MDKTPPISPLCFTDALFLGVRIIRNQQDRADYEKEWRAQQTARMNELQAIKASRALQVDSAAPAAYTKRGSDSAAPAAKRARVLPSVQARGRGSHGILASTPATFDAAPARRQPIVPVFQTSSTKIPKAAPAAGLFGAALRAAVPSLVAAPVLPASVALSAVTRTSRPKTTGTVVASTSEAATASRPASLFAHAMRAVGGLPAPSPVATLPAHVPPPVAVSRINRPTQALYRPRAAAVEAIAEHSAALAGRKRTTAARAAVLPLDTKRAASPAAVATAPTVHRTPLFIMEVDNVCLYVYFGDDPRTLAEHHCREHGLDFFVEELAAMIAQNLACVETPDEESS